MEWKERDDMGWGGVNGVGEGREGKAREGKGKEEMGWDGMERSSERLKINSTTLTLLGRPVVPRILLTWSKCEVPEKIGRPSSATSSPKMHPVLHMSTPVPYASDPRRSSGARYHLWPM